MRLTAQEEAILGGKRGPALQRLLRMQVAVGEFFDAPDLVPVSSAHVMADIEAIGDAGLAFIEELADAGQQCAVPTTNNPRSVDFGCWKMVGSDASVVAKEQRIVQAFRRLGIVTINSCIPYQTIVQPHFGEHLAWGDTGTVIWANAVLGARSNFEGGPVALAAALTGRTPRYGYHLPEQRRGTVRVEVADGEALREPSDWGVLGCLAGRGINDYWKVPVFTWSNERQAPPQPGADGLKQLGASLASYGSLAMFHLPGITAEARTDREAFGGPVPAPALTIEPGEIARCYASFAPTTERVTLVVLGTPQLSLLELRRIAQLLDGRRLDADVRLYCTTSQQVKAAADDLGYTAAIETAGGVVLSTVCFYIMTANELRQRHGYHQLVTDSAKLANIIPGYGYHPVLRRTAACIEAAVSGRI